MKVIVVHDRQEVADKIVEMLSQQGIINEDICHVLDAVSARNALTNERYDLAVIDLTIPHIFGRDKPSYQVADHLISEIYLLDHLYVPGDVIGITADMDAFNSVSTSIAANVMTIVQQSKDCMHWLEALREKVDYISRAASHRNRAFNSSHDYDVLIVTALDEELEPIKNFYDVSELPSFDRALTFAFVDRGGRGRRGVAFSVGAAGEAKAASFTQSLIGAFRPKLALMTGICGGVPEKTKLGDVIIAESALDWDYGKWQEEAHPADAPTLSEGDARPNGALKFVSRPDPQSISGTKAHGVARDLLTSGIDKNPEIIDEIKRESKGLVDRLKIRLAPFGSGSAVVGSDVILTQVRSLNDAIRGVDMESFGFYFACRHSKVIAPEAMCIKSVCDFADGTKNDEYHEACSFMSAMVARHIIEKIWDFA